MVHGYDKIYENGYNSLVKVLFGTNHHIIIMKGKKSTPFNLFLTKAIKRVPVYRTITVWIISFDPLDRGLRDTGKLRRECILKSGVFGTESGNRRVYIKNIR